MLGAECDNTIHRFTVYSLQLIRGSLLLYNNWGGTAPVDRSYRPAKFALFFDEFLSSFIFMSPSHLFSGVKERVFFDFELKETLIQ